MLVKCFPQDHQRLKPNMLQKPVEKWTMYSEDCPLTDVDEHLTWNHVLHFQWIKTVFPLFPPKLKLIDDRKQNWCRDCYWTGTRGTVWEGGRTTRQRTSATHKDDQCAAITLKSLVLDEKSLIATRCHNVTNLSFTASNDTQLKKNRAQNKCLKLMKWVLSYCSKLMRIQIR